MFGGKGTIKLKIDNPNTELYDLNANKPQS